MGPLKLKKANIGPLKVLEPKIVKKGPFTRIPLHKLPGLAVIGLRFANRAFKNICVCQNFDQ